MTSRYTGCTMCFVALLVAGCEARQQDVDVEPGLETTADPGPSPVEEGDVTAGPTPSAPQAHLAVADHPEYGLYLTDGDGRALYLLESDPPGSSTCYDACAVAWPPFLAPAGGVTPATTGAQANLIGTIQRRDGSTQITYAGHPLYYYQEDQGPGRVTGQDVHDEWGEWYLVTPPGEPLEEGGS